MSAVASAPKRVDLVLMWHMHQPDYRDHATGEFRLPWVYLHALKDYTDMAAHLERHPRMRAVVNFAPVLLDQLEDYADQFASNRIRDRLLRMLGRDETEPLAAGDRAFILERCFEANHERIIRAFPAYRALLGIFTEVERHGADARTYLSDQYFHDLVTWYHLGWTGESVRRESEHAARLIAKGAHFTQSERSALFDVVGAAIRDVIPRWARLGQSGRVELSTTPEYHPLAPLLIDFATAREALPSCVIPAGRYPGGRERVAAHIDAALASHARRFDRPAGGVWPAEGGISEELVQMLAERRVRWTASGGQVLRNSVAASRGVQAELPPHRPWHVRRDTSLTCFFRDDFLSDRIGFEYAKWNGDDAARDLIAAVAGIGAAATEGETPLVSIILDGENCWEYYPYNGHYFLDALYHGLSDHATIRPTTYTAWLDERARVDTDPARRPLAAGALERLVAGSWVGGNFTTWIGAPEKNHAWELLIAAKAQYDLARARLPSERLPRAERQLAACEASDWFWWLASANPAAAVAELEHLFRMHLSHLYILLGEAPPAALARPIARGGGTPEAGGTMRRATEHDA
ncbi:MAG TPA: glycoside hydrolase family 57 protein [Casimicrobiaceae bacterium]